MWPLVGIPESIAQGMAAYRSVFCQDAGLELFGYSLGLSEVSPRGVDDHSAGCGGVRH